MTTVERVCNYVNAAHKMAPRLPRGATYAQVVAALADAGFLGATAGELQTFARHMRGFTAIRRERTVLLKETIELMRQHGVAEPEFGSAVIRYLAGPFQPTTTPGRRCFTASGNSRMTSQKPHGA